MFWVSTMVADTGKVNPDPTLKKQRNPDSSDYKNWIWILLPTLEKHLESGSKSDLIRNLPLNLSYKIRHGSGRNCNPVCVVLWTD